MSEEDQSMKGVMPASEAVIKEEGSMQTRMAVDPQQVGVDPQAVGVDPQSVAIMDDPQMNPNILQQLPGTYFVVPKTPGEVISKLEEERLSLLRVKEALNIQLQNLQDEAAALQKTKEQFEAAQAKVCSSFSSFQLLFHFFPPVYLFCIFRRIHFIDNLEVLLFDYYYHVSLSTFFLMNDILYSFYFN